MNIQRFARLIRFLSAVILVLPACNNSVPKSEPSAAPRHQGEPEVVFRIPLSHGPGGLALDAGGRRLAVADGNELRLFSWETDGPPKAGEGWTLPERPAWPVFVKHPPAVCVAVPDLGHVAVLPLTAGAKALRVSLPFKPGKLVADPVQPILLVMHPDVPYASVVNTLTGGSDLVSLGGESLAGALAPDRRFYYVATQEDAGKVAVLDRADWAPVAKIPTGADPRAVVMDAQGRLAFTANAGSHSVTMIYVLEHNPMLSIPVGSTPVELALSPSGRFLYVSCAQQQTLEIVDVERHQTVRRLQVGGIPGSLAVGPEGRRICLDVAFTGEENGAGQLLIIDTGRYH